MISMHQDGSLYEDHAVDNFHKPPRTDASFYLDLEKNLRSSEIQSNKLNANFPAVVTSPSTIRLSQALSTPDVTTLLTSVGQSTATTTQAPTPTRFLRGHAVTAEQEMYAQGFIDALNELHTGGTDPGRQPQATKLPSSSQLNAVHDIPRSVIHHTTDNEVVSAPFTGPNPSLESVAPTYVTATMAHIPSNISASQTESMSAFHNSTVHNFSTNTYTMPMMNLYTGSPAIESYGTVGTYLGHPTQVATGGPMPPQLMKEIQRVVPADMKTQEHMKVERKKARNRIAASKCRLRRLQRESDLQGKVRILKDHNQELNNEVSGLKEQISNLKKALIQHMKGGCHVNLPEGIRAEALESVSSEC